MLIKSAPGSSWQMPPQFCIPYFLQTGDNGFMMNYSVFTGLNLPGVLATGRLTSREALRSILIISSSLSVTTLNLEKVTFHSVDTPAFLLKLTTLAGKTDCFRHFIPLLSRTVLRQCYQLAILPPFSVILNQTSI